MQYYNKSILDKHTIKQIIELTALEVEVHGMIADNQQRELEGNSMAYTGEDFDNIAKQMRDIATKYNNEQA